MKLFEERPLVYVAGPYTNGDPVENTHLTLKLADHLMDTGLVTCYVPHISLFWHVVNPRHYEHWLEYDLAILKVCHALFRRPGPSDGADKEEIYAKDRNIPCFYAEDILLDWARDWKYAGV